MHVPLAASYICFASLGIEFSLPLVEERRKSKELQIPQEDEGVEQKDKAEEWVFLLCISVTVLHLVK